MQQRPSNQCLTGLINLSVSSPWTDSGGVTGICMKVQPPSSCGMPLVTAAWCGFLRDGIEGRWEVGMFPLPQRNTLPLPTGVDSRSIQCQGCASPHPVPGEKPPEDPVSSPCTVSGLSPCTARPLEGGGRRPRERPGGGGWSTARIENRSR